MVPGELFQEVSRAATSNPKNISKYEKIRYFAWLHADYYSVDCQCHWEGST